MYPFSASLGTDDYKYGGTATLKPSEIRFSHDNIANRFRGGFSLNTTLAQLLNGSLTPDCLPKIDVIYKDGLPFVVNGNRRLYLYKLLEDGGLLKELKVSILPTSQLSLLSGKFTTIDNGLSVSIRHDSLLRSTLQQMVKDYKTNPTSVSASLLSSLSGNTSSLGYLGLGFGRMRRNTRSYGYYDSDSDSDIF